MGRTITSTLLIILAVIMFLSFVDPTYKEIKVLAAENEEFDEALDRSRELQSVRDDLLSKYNTFSTENLNKIEKLLPDNVDNVRLILDLDGIASQYGIVIKGLTILGDNSSNESGDVVIATTNLGEIELSFNVDASYEDFKRFMKDLEQSLRIVDMKKLTITPKIQGEDLFGFGLNIKTYWLK